MARIIGKAGGGPYHFYANVLIINVTINPQTGACCTIVETL